MSVRAKFKVVRFESMLASRRMKSEDGSAWTNDYEPVEMRTVILSPVYANNDPNHENSRF